MISSTCKITLRWSFIRGFELVDCCGFRPCWCAPRPRGVRMMPTGAGPIQVGFKRLMGRLLSSSAFEVVLLSGTGDCPDESADVEVIRTALGKLGWRGAG